MRPHVLALLAIAGCQATPPRAPKAPPVVVMTAPREPAVRTVRLPPPMLPVDCNDITPGGTLEFCGQRVDTSTTHFACHRTDQASTAALACLPELRSLTLRGCPVTRLEPIGTLKKLRRLNLSETRAANLKPLAELTSLRELALDETHVTDLSPLAELPALQKLRLRRVAGAEWGTLSGLPALTELDVTHNERPDFRGLAGHRSLQVVLTSDTIADFAPLASMPALRKLAVHNDRSGGVSPETRSRTFAGISAVTQVRELELHETVVTTLAPLAAMTQLESLWVDGKHITSIAAVASLKNLTFFGITHTKGLGERRQAELASLGTLPRLVNLTVFTSPSDTSYLKSFVALEGLILSSEATQPFDLAGISNAPKLEILSLRGGRVSSLSAVRGIKSLRRLEIKPPTNVEDAEVEALRKARPRLYVEYNPATGDDW